MEGEAPETLQKTNDCWFDSFCTVCHASGKILVFASKVDPVDKVRILKEGRTERATNKVGVAHKFKEGWQEDHSLRELFL